jgi:hypothetical protein
MERAERFDDPHGDGEGVAGHWLALELGPVDGGEDTPAPLFTGGGDTAELGDGFHKKERRITGRAAGHLLPGKGGDSRFQGENPIENEKGGAMG